MKIAIVQNDILWAQPKENLKRISALMDERQTGENPAEPIGLYVLPEMFATGFVTQPKDIAEPEDNGPILNWMRLKAHALDAAVAGSVAVATDGGFRNRFYFVKPDGEVAFYDKRHLFAYGGEDEHYRKGGKRVVVSFRGVRFLLQVCYDLRFPVWSRNRGDYDVALYVASWPESRHDVWLTLLRARAIENQCYVVGVNRVGNDPACSYRGGTMMVDAYGKTVVACREHVEETAADSLDMQRLENFRRKFPVLKDGDHFSVATIR